MKSLYSKLSYRIFVPTFLFLVEFCLSFSSYGQIKYRPRYLQDSTSNLRKDSKSLGNDGWVDLAVDIDTSEFFSRYADDLGLTANKKLSLKKDKELKDLIGIIHQRFQLYYDNVRVEGLEYSLHSKNGKVITANGRIVSNISFDTKNVLPLQAILVLINSALDTKIDLADLTSKDSKGRSSGELIIFQENIADFSPANFRLAYKIQNISIKNPFDIVDIYVDAKNGKIIQKISNIHRCFANNNSPVHIDAPNVQYSKFKLSHLFEPDNSTFIPLARYSNRYLNGQSSIPFQTAPYYGYNNPHLIASVGNGYGRVWTKKFNGQNIFAPRNHEDQEHQWQYDIPDVTNPSPNYNWGSYEQEATTSQWIGIKSYDYFLNVHGRHGSTDNLNYYTIDRMLTNIPEYAFGDFIGPSFVEWGNYDGQDLIIVQSFNNESFATVDILGHEYTHGVTRYASNLVYRGESGALNEGLSDIFGTCIERATLPNSWNWLIGEDLGLGLQLRDMRNPSSIPNNGSRLQISQPNTYLGTNWRNTNDLSFDNGGVHVNSGVLNKWFNLICEGGSQNGTNVNAIPFDHAEHIVYVAFTYYVHSQDAYADARAATIQAATNLYGNCSNEYRQVVRAWGAVGLQIANTCPVDCNFTVNPSTSSSSCGAQGILSANCSGAGCSDLTYSWTGANNFSANGSSVAFTIPNANGNYQYTVNATKAGCGTVSVSTVVNVSNCGSTASCSPITANNCYNIRVSKTGQRLQAMGDGTINQQPTNNQNNQIWKAEDSGGGQFRFTIQDGTNRVVTSNSGNYGEGLALSGYGGSDGQKWTTQCDNANNVYRIYRSSGTTWDLNNYGNSPQLQLYGNTSEAFFDYRSFGFDAATCPTGTPPPPPSGSLTINAPAYNCQTGALTIQTSGGNNSTIEYQIPGLGGWSTNPNFTVPSYQTNGTSFTLQARQSGTEAPSYQFTTTCGTPPPPPTGGLAFGTPSFDCTSGQLIINTTGGNGSPVEFRAPGLQDWNTNNVFSIPSYQRNGTTFTIQARQSGTEINPLTYTTSCAGYRLAAAGAETTDVEGIVIAPNPTHGQFTVRFQLGSKQPATLSIVNVLGQSVLQREVVGTGQPQTETIDLGRDIAGQYMVRLKVDGKVQTGKLLLVR